jgi:aspartyl-tRNA(Asn)/glutamyl-tRNA(Gln) amidotransferase subunit A
MITRRTLVGSAIAAAVARGAQDGLEWKTLEAVSALLRQKKISPVELTRCCLARIEKLNSSLNAFITVTADRALEQAKTLESEAQAGKWRSPLHGVPIALKDLYDTEGVRTTAASKHWADRVPSQDADVVRRLKSAGAVLLGKLNMDEFAYNFTGDQSFFGTIYNPWNPKRSPGGSSGGSAAAIAAGLCFGTLGSDTGGSIRLPAAFCGITGLKPTYGLVSAAGVVPLAWSLDHVGPMCRTAKDCALMLEALTGKPLRDSAVRVKGLRLGIPRAIFYDALDTEVAAATAAATDVLRRITAGVHDAILPALRMSKDLPDLPESYIRIIGPEAYAFHEEMVRTRPEGYLPGILANIKSGSAATAAQYIRAKQDMERLRNGMSEYFRDTDLMITPTSPGAAFELGERRLVFLRNTAPWNLLGLPTISIPCGFTKQGLPIGLQITGAAGRDDTVLALAAAYQKETDWHTRHAAI